MRRDVRYFSAGFAVVSLIFALVNRMSGRPVWSHIILVGICFVVFIIATLLPQKETSGEPIIRTLSKWQTEENCIFCPREAVSEAVFGRAAIRCCYADGCQSSAKIMAKEIGSRKQP